ncbi:hypothetical protein CS369_07690 [Candidatus Symbiopectobacterium sp. 'North America']|nr:hypothetical protein [Candidatus Symbiopectobacterium sp. 'North America']
MLWASNISRNTILIKSLPELTIYITFASTLGLIFAAKVAYQRPLGKSPKYIFEVFFSWFCMGFVLILNIFDVYVYLFPDEVITYTSEYEIVFPGPSRGKSGRCEAGLWVKDRHTNQWKQLCINQKILLTKRKQGMTYLHMIFTDP